MHTPQLPLLRTATPADLERVWDIRFANDVAGASTIPQRGTPPPYLAHLLAHGTLLIAERDGRVVGYAGRVDRGGVAYLTDLFVDLAHQSGAIGRSLLQRIFADDPPVRCTLASSDFRALALYTRAGMTPRWPNVLLRATAESQLCVTAGQGRVGAGRRERPRAARLGTRRAAAGCGLHDLLFLPHRRARPGVLVSARQRDRRLRHRSPRGRPPLVSGGGHHRSAWGGDRRRTRSTVSSRPWPGQESGAPVIELAVPGPQPALKPLLDAGFAIEYVETYCASDPVLVDPTRYVGSGGDLF